MKKVNILILIVGITFFSVGVGGYVLARGRSVTEEPGYGIKTQVDDRIIGYTNEFHGTSSMMTGGYGFDTNTNNGEKYDLDILTEEVESYISQYDEDLIIDDIFIFEDSEYYYSIIEENTGRGAMELLVNPYTKTVLPEYGPNMMWNLKYGMHYSGGMMSCSGMMGNQGYSSRSGMMGSHGFNGRSGMMGGGMMGNSYAEDYFDSSAIENNELNSEEAYNEGMDYLNRRSETLTLGNEYHEFYGYYTFHVEENGEPVGMLSVNGITGDVWYHDWHGVLSEIIEGHETDVH
jgi:hypothetical protein